LQKLSNNFPGYVIVSAINPRSQAKLVLDYKITVSDNSYFMSNISRKAYFTSGLKETETYFEIDDSGKPWFISLITTPQVALNAKTVTSVIVTDAETGVTNTLSPADVITEYPWIDRIISEDYTKEKIEWYGELTEGYWNTLFGGLNINKPTTYAGNELWFVEVNGRTMFFTIIK